MAASRMSRIANCRLALLSLVMAVTLAGGLSDAVASAENVEDVELITVPRAGNEFVAIAGADSDDKVSTSPSDLKKNSLNKKPQKFYPKTEADWNFKGEGKKTDVFIKDPKDHRLLRIISEGLLTPQDVLPIVSNDAIISSQKNDSKAEMKVNVQPEGMSGVVNDGIAVDSDEMMIIEKKKNATTEKTVIKIENDTSTESDENVKINLDANAGVQNPIFHKQKGSITVPVQKQISLSKGKDSHAHKKTYENSGYDVIPLNKQKGKFATDEGVFDFVDSPLSDKHLVSAGTAQTSRINVKKGPNGQDYEYEYIYYYYEDPDDPATPNNERSHKGNEIPVTGGPTLKTTTPVVKISSPPPPKFTVPFTEDTSATRIKTTDILNEPPPPPPLQPQPQPSREKFRNDFRYTVENAPVLPQQIPSGSTKNLASNEIYWQYDASSRFPGRQAQHQTISEQPLITKSQEIETTTTRPQSRGRTHYNPSSPDDDGTFIVTALPVSTQQPARETATRSKSTSGTVRQPGLELVDSNSFRTHSTNLPVEYDIAYSPAQTFDSPRGKSLKQSSQEFSTVPQNLPTAQSAKSETFRKEPTPEYVPTTGTERFATGTERFPTNTERFSSTIPPRSFSPVATETAPDNTAPFSTLSENSLTTVYSAGLTDKAAHDLYAIYQQTQNEETVKNTIAVDDRTTVVDEPVNTFIRTNPPTTILYTTISTTTTTTTTTTTPAPTTTSSPASISLAPTRGRFRGNGSRNKLSPTSTEATAPSEAVNESKEKPRAKFQPSYRREPGQRGSVYGRRGSSSTTSSNPPLDGEVSSTVASDQESSKPSWLNSPSRTKFRSTTPRTEGPGAEGQSTSSSNPRPNFADRYNPRRRPGLRASTSTTTAAAVAAEEELAGRQDTGKTEVPVVEQQSTTHRSIRNRVHSNRPKPLRPEIRLNFSSRGRLGGTSSTSASPLPLDTDTSGSADVPVEQKQTEENGVPQEIISETTVSSAYITTTSSTPVPDALTRLKHRPKLRIGDKGSHAKAQAQQLNHTANINQNRRNLVHNLLPRKRLPQTSTEAHEQKEEKVEIAPKPVTEISEDETAPKSEVEISESELIAEASSTTENKLSFLLASRRHNHAGRKPGPFQRTNNKQTANEES